MTSKEALEEIKRILYEETTFKEDADALLNPIEKALEVLGKLKAKTNLLYKDRKEISKEFDRWCEDNNLANCSENMATWFLSIKLKEWLGK